MSEVDWVRVESTTVEVGLAGGKFIVLGLDIVSDGGGCGRTVERVVTVTVDWKDVPDVDVADKPIGEVDVDIVVNVSVSVVKVKGVWDIQVENGERVEIIELVVGLGFGAGKVDEIEEVILNEGVGKEQNCVASADDTPRKRSEYTKWQERNRSTV